MLDESLLGAGAGVSRCRVCLCKRKGLIAQSSATQYVGVLLWLVPYLLCQNQSLCRLSAVSLTGSLGLASRDDWEALLIIRKYTVLEVTLAYLALLTCHNRVEMCSRGWLSDAACLVSGMHCTSRMHACLAQVCCTNVSQ